MDEEKKLNVNTADIIDIVATTPLKSPTPTKTKTNNNSIEIGGADINFVNEDKITLELPLEMEQLPDLDENDNNNLKTFTEIAELTAITTSHTNKLKNQNSDITNVRSEVYKLIEIFGKLKFEIANLNKNFVAEQTIREMINRAVDLHDKSIKNSLIESNREIRMQIFNYQKDVNQVENKIKELENKVYNQSTEITTFSDTVGSLLTTREDLSQLKYYVEKKLQLEIDNLISDYTGKALDKKIQKWITFYHDNHKSVKLDFDRLYSDNKELVENIKNDYSLVGNIKNEIKKDLFNDIVEYNSKFREFLENKKFVRYLEDLSNRSDKVLTNIMREQETRRFFEELKQHIEQIKE